MPRFSEIERQQIRIRLLAEGERLFTLYGIKKVTIDDLAEAAGIAKASFYKFYENKEYLYLDIAQELQKKVFDKLSSVLESNANLPGRERILQVFEEMLKITSSNPLLAQIDIATVKLISRRVSKERLTEFYMQNVDAAQLMHSHGINFTCDIETASCLFQTLYQSWMYLQDKGADMQAVVTDILLNGVIEQIVAL